MNTRIHPSLNMNQITTRICFVIKKGGDKILREGKRLWKEKNQTF